MNGTLKIILGFALLILIGLGLSPRKSTAQAVKMKTETYASISCSCGEACSCLNCEKTACHGTRRRSVVTRSTVKHAVSDCPGGNCSVIQRQKTIQRFRLRR